MIVDLILLVFKGVLTVLLLPISVFNVTIDFLSSIPVVVSFLQIVAYVIPWSNILPLILLIIVIFSFRIGVSVFKFILNVIH